MAMKIISKGKKKNGTETAQVVINGNGKSQTKHLCKIYGVWKDKDAKNYDLK